MSLPSARFHVSPYNHSHPAYKNPMTQSKPSTTSSPKTHAGYYCAHSDPSALNPNPRTSSSIFDRKKPSTSTNDNRRPSSIMSSSSTIDSLDKEKEQQPKRSLRQVMFGNTARAYGRSKFL